MTVLDKQIRERLARYGNWRLDLSPNYVADVWAALLILERICRERSHTYEARFDGNSFTVQVWGKRERNERKGTSEWPLVAEQTSDTLARAAAIVSHRLLEPVSP